MSDGDVCQTVNMCLPLPSTIHKMKPQHLHANNYVLNITDWGMKVNIKIKAMGMNSKTTTRFKFCLNTKSLF